MEKSWKIDPWKIHGKFNAKTIGKTMGNSMENPWKIHGKSMDNKNGKKEMFPWYSMPHKKYRFWAQKLGSDLTPNGIIID